MTDTNRFATVGEVSAELCAQRQELQRMSDRIEDVAALLLTGRRAVDLASPDAAPRDTGEARAWDITAAAIASYSPDELRAFIVDHTAVRHDPTCCFVCAEIRSRATAAGVD